MTSPTPTPEVTPTPTTTPPIERPAITPEIQKLIDDAAKGARMEGERLGKKAAEDVLAAKAEEERVKRENDEALKRGEFDTVKASLETEAKTHKERADAAESELKTIWEDRKTQMDEGIKTFDKDLPDWKYDPGENAPIADRWKWFQKAKETSDAALTSKVNNLRKVPGTPRPNSDPAHANDDDAKRAQARNYRDF